MENAHNKSMDVRAKQRFCYHAVRQTLAGLVAVSPHVISIVRCFVVSGKHLVYHQRKMESFDRFITAIEQNNISEIERLILGGFALNEPDEDGAPVLYVAIMHGNLQIVRLLLERGANPNFLAEEPAATIYDEKPLNLAQGLRFITDWDKYQPIAKLLVEFGATDSEERADFSEEDLKVTEQRAKEWQATKSS